MTSVKCQHYSSFGYASGIPPWIKCSYCDDFHCTIHHEHVADCDCPRIDVWLDYGLDPYSPVEEYQIPRLQAMLSQNPACDPSEETDDSVAAFDPSEEHF